MGCCGQGREALRGQTARASRGQVVAAGRQVPSARAASSAATTERMLMAVRYLERAEVVVRGQHSGRTYRFSAASPVLLVEVRDADALLRSRLFMRAV